MGSERRIFRTATTWEFVLTLLCVLLVVASGTVQVAHTHSDRALSHSDCSLCAAAHITIHTAQTPALTVPVAIITPVAVTPVRRVPVSVCIFALFTRPPPAVSLPA